MRDLVLLILLASNSTIAIAQIALKEVSSLSDSYLVTFNEPLLGQRPVTGDRNAYRNHLVKLRQRLEMHAENLQKDMLDTDLVVDRKLWIRQAVAIRLAPINVQRLKRLSYIRDVQPDRAFRVQAQATLPISGQNAGDDIASIDIDTLWSQSFQGQGVVVAVLDTGVDVLHKDLRDRWRGGTNSWFDPYGEHETPVDTLDATGNAHGTAVASIIVGGNQNETGNYLGVAPQATWIAARVINNQNTTESAISSALQWVLDPDNDPLTDDFPDIVQNSWGLAGSEGACINPFEQELAALDAAGIDIVFSVGNSGPGASSYLTPAFDQHVISVGAIDANNDILNTSARGPDDCNSEIIPSLVAPGDAITVADWTAGGLNSNLDNVVPLSGTSFSAPMVAGVLALLRSKYNADNHLEFRRAIYNSTLALGATSPGDDFGRGLVQASAAAARLDTAASAANPVVTEIDRRVNFSSARYEVDEADASVVISVIRSGDISSAADVRVVSVDGSATSGQDYLAVDQTLDFLPGESAKTVEITLIDDSDSEGSERFNLLFVAPFTGLQLGNDASIPVSISDNDDLEEEDEIGGSAFAWLDILALFALGLIRIKLK